MTQTTRFRTIFFGLMMISLSACGYPTKTRTVGGVPPASTTKVKVGKPYSINGIWYYPKDDPAYMQTGEASWYGPGFHGKKTASGEIYNQNDLTAAHRTLPMPSYIEVVNLSNNRRVILKVNDRGPFARGRIVDVSRRAAQLLGFQNKGVQKVRVRRTDRWGNPLVVSQKPAQQLARQGEDQFVPGPLFIQVGSFLNYDNAHQLQISLRDLGAISLEAAIVDGQTTYRVRIGPFNQERDAHQTLNRVVDRGYQGARIITQKKS